MVRHHELVMQSDSAAQGDRAPSLLTSGERTEIEVVAGDFDTFYTKHRNEIGSALGFTLGSQALGEEAVDEAMARAYQQWKKVCLLYTSPSPRDRTRSRMPSSA